MLDISAAYMGKSQKTNSVDEEFTFTKFEDLFVWLDKFKGSPQIGTGVLLYFLAKDGRTGLSNRRETIDIKFESKDYFQARKIAIEAGLLKGRGGSDVYVRTHGAGLAFARAMDIGFVVAQT